MAINDYEERMNEVFNQNKNSKKKSSKQQIKENNAANKNTKNTKKQKKGKKMYDGYGAGAHYGFGTGGVTGAAVTGTLLTGDDVVNITLSESKKNRGYIFYMQKDLQEIFKKSGKNAIDNEFQVHYWFLNFRFQAEDKSIIDIAIPTCYFNYEQFVTTGHVDFELKDVGPLSEKLVPVHNMKVNELLAFEIDKKINAVFDNKLQFEAMSVNFGTMHRHPGSSAHQNFSATDLNINVKTEAHALGVVFPLADAEDDKPSFSAIIALDGPTYYNKSAEDLKANLAHCEYRNANGKIQTGLHYEKHRCIAFNVMPAEQPSIVEKLFGAKPTRKSTVKYSNTDVALFQPEEKLLEIFEDLESKWEASTLAVFPENVKTKVQTVTVRTANLGNVQHQPTFTYADSKKDIEANSNIVDNQNEGTVKETYKHIPKSPYDKYLLAKSELTKIKQDSAFIETVKKYLSIENEKNYLKSVDLTVECLSGLIANFNTMSSLFYGKGHREEEVSFYVVNNIVDLRDVSDFLNENITIAMSIAEDTHCNIQTIKDYENSDHQLLKSTHLYTNPFSDVVSENASVAQNNAVAAKETTNAEESALVPETIQEPENDGIITSALNKFKSVLKG